ncbi:hypothetical protein B7463_g857, partial [Scytalidium lignicola]
MPSDIFPPAELLRYLPDYRVLICLSCQYAIQPGALARHLKEIHRVLRSYRRPYMQYVAGFPLDKPEQVIAASIKEFPVPFLPIQDGLQCDSCPHLCISEKRMRHHWSTKHDRKGDDDADWHSVPVQTFFRGNMIHYFTSPPSTRLSELDTLLLDHFISSTSLTLAPDTVTRGMWQSTIPQLAHQNAFLMHGLLACAALHLAVTDSSQQRDYAIIASTHQGDAMRLFRTAITNLSKDNCDAVLVFSYLLVICSFASEKQDEALFLVDQNSMEVLPSWLHLLRTGCSTLCDVWDCLASGPVRTLALAWDLPITPSANHDTTELVDYLLSAASQESCEETWSDSVCRIYNEAATELAPALSHAHLLGDSFTTWDALRTWPIRVSDEYMDLLVDGHTGALILLAHYCILLKKVEENWYFEGRATRLLSTILSRLDKRLHPYIQWPLEVFKLR